MKNKICKHPASLGCTWVENMLGDMIEVALCGVCGEFHDLETFEIVTDTRAIMTWIGRNGQEMENFELWDKFELVPSKETTQLKKHFRCENCGEDNEIKIIVKTKYEE